MNRNQFATVINIFGYIAMYIQWAWLLILFIPAIAASGVLNRPPQVEQAPTMAFDAITRNESLGWLFVILSAILVTIVIGFTVYSIVKGPALLAQESEQVITKAVATVLPRLTHHKKITKKKRLLLGRRLRYTIKVLLCTLPFFLLATTTLVPNELPLTIIFAVGLMLLPWGLLWFSLAYAIEPRPIPTPRRSQRKVSHKNIPN